MPKFLSASALLAGLLVVATLAAAQADRGDHVYRMTLLRAAPGRVLDLVQDVKTRVAANLPPDRGRPLLLRHSQGDQWDLFVFIPRGAGAAAPIDTMPLAASEWVAWQQDEVVRGPEVWSAPGFTEAGLCHIEMFVALAGKRDELVRERQMENAYARALGRPVTAIYVREFGAEWDAFTIGPYRSWKHYAERDDIKPEASLAAAKQAGFESDAHIGAYMRSLINTHHDTLLTVIK
jgi:hypothetical protein